MRVFLINLIHSFDVIMPVLLIGLMHSVCSAELPIASPLEGATAAVSGDWKAETLKRFKSGNEFGRPSAGDDGIVLTTEKLAPNPYTLDIGLPTTVPIQSGQVMLLRFAARSLKAADMTGQTQLNLYFQKTSPNWFKSIELGITLSDQWQRFDVPFKVLNDYAAGEAGMYFAYGYAPQAAEIADVQLLAFPVGTDLTKLPRTQRLAGEVDPTLYKEAIDRIAKFRTGMAGRIGTKADVVKTPGRTLYVSANAADAGDGSETRPLKTIQAALDVVQPGESVSVAAGVYDQGKDGQSHARLTTSGKPDAWISIHAAAGVRPKIVSSAWKAIELSGVSYVEVAGFEIEGVSTAANKNSGNGIAILNRSTHIRILDNIVHGVGGGGIYSATSDYVHIEGNSVFNTSKGSDWGNSAISLYQCINSDDFVDGYKNVVRRNICYDNENLRPFKFGGGSITDGNGVIMDDNRHTQNKSKEGAYQGWTLIENNLVFNNGGRGLHSYKSDHIDVINNTVVMNQKSKDIRNGELTAIQSSQMCFINNVVVTQPNLRANGDDRSKNIIFAKNLYAGTDDFLAGHEPVIGKDPEFAAASSDATGPTAFELKPGSPAIGRGVREVAPPDDLLGRPRGASIDLGALQFIAK